MSDDGPDAGSDLPSPEPHVTPETVAYWEAAGDGRLLVGYCTDCGEHFFYPRRRCPLCAGADVEYVEAEGTGTVHARTIVRQAGGDYAEATPYVLAYVELDEGPRMLTNVVGADPEDVEVGDRVEVTFDAVAGDVALPRFRPA
jgi:uncharacterized OB-fold protein